MRGILRRWSGEKRRRIVKRPALMVECMEGRALMAAGSFGFLIGPIMAPAFQFQSARSFTVLTVTSANRPLFDALQSLFAEMESTFGRNGADPVEPAPTTPATVPPAIQAGVDQIATLAGPNAAQAVSRLSDDMLVVVEEGRLTPTSRATIVADLRTIFAVSTASGVAVLPTGGSLPGTPRSLARRFPSDLDLTDPNALDSVAASQKRGQSADSTSAAATLLGRPSAGGLAGSGAMGQAFNRLMNDFKAALARSQAITAEQKAAVAKDFAEVIASARRPSRESIATLKADLRAGAGGLTDARRDLITADVKAVLTSAGISDTLRDRAVANFQPILHAADLDPTALRTVLLDLANILSIRPRGASPFGGWWLGGRPR